MAIFYYKSARGDILPLSEAENYKLTNIDAQTSAVTNISSVVVGGADGDSVNNINAQPRTVILDLRIIAEVEKTKRAILNIIKLKQQGTIIWEQDERRLELSGIIEAISMPRWNNAVIMQITLHCEQPFWENIDDVISEISEAIDLHYFTDETDDMLYFPEEGIAFGEFDTLRTREIHNAGDVAVGMEIEIVALDTVTNPIIYNQDGKFFGCGYGSGNKKIVMEAGDVIRINTRKNEKDATLNGNSILGKIKPNSTWLQLEGGDNEFSISAEETSVNNMTYTLKYRQRYI